MLTQTQPIAGRLLISEPFLADPNFRRSVILLAEHNAEGTVGFVLNHPSSLMVKDIVPELWSADFPVFFGGPVEVDTLHFIHRRPDLGLEGLQIATGLFWGGDFTLLCTLLNDNELQKEDVKIFLGYSGWSPEQLEAELLENTWMVSELNQLDTVFSHDQEAIWKEVIIDLGPKYAHISNFPIDPNLN